MPLRMSSKDGAIQADGALECPVFATAVRIGCIRLRGNPVRPRVGFDDCPAPILVTSEEPRSVLA